MIKSEAFKRLFYTRSFTTVRKCAYVYIFNMQNCAQWKTFLKRVHCIFCDQQIHHDCVSFTMCLPRCLLCHSNAWTNKWWDICFHWLCYSITLICYCFAIHDRNRSLVYIKKKCIMLLACVTVVSGLVLSDEDSNLSVSIPMEQPLRPLLGGKTVIPCYFQDNTVHDPGAPTIAPLSQRIKWSYIYKGTISLILVAIGGTVHTEPDYVDRVTMVNYPSVPTDVTIEISELRSKDSGTYRCEVMQGIEDNYDSVEMHVQGDCPYISQNIKC